MDNKPKYNIGDKVYIIYPYQDGLYVEKWTIRIIHLQKFIDSNGVDKTIKYGFEDRADTRTEEEIAGKTESDVYRHIDKHYDNKIKEINDEKQDTINKFKDR